MSVGLTDIDELNACILFFRLWKLMTRFVTVGLEVLCGGAFWGGFLGVDEREGSKLGKVRLILTLFGGEGCGMAGGVSSFCLGERLAGVSVVWRDESGWKGLESKYCVERSSKKLEEKFGMPHCMHSHEVEVLARDFQTVGLIWTHF